VREKESDSACCWWQKDDNFAKDSRDLAMKQKTMMVMEMMMIDMTTYAKHVRYVAIECVAIKPHSPSPPKRARTKRHIPTFLLSCSSKAKVSKVF
jgi:hypothetical protein